MSLFIRRQALRPSTPMLQRQQARLASGDYGSGSGDPKGENPQEQGPNPSANKEHPGPPPPAVGQGSGSTPTKGTAEGHNVSQDSSTKPTHGNDPTQQKRSYSTVARRNFSTSLPTRSPEEGSSDDSSSSTAQTKRDEGTQLRSDKTKGAQPKILAESPPGEGEQDAEVKRHNEEMDQRAERPAEKVKKENLEDDKVGKGFWSGQGGADRDP